MEAPLGAGLEEQYQEPVLKKRLASWGKKVVIRMPIIPGVNDSRENVEAAGRFISSLGNVVQVQLLPYHTTGVEKYARMGIPYSLPGVLPAPRRGLNSIAEELRRFHPAVSIGG